MDVFISIPIGTRLKNNAIVIAQRHDIVLCILPHNRVHPYATWRVGPDGDTGGGDYCRTIEEGVASLAERAPGE